MKKLLVLVIVLAIISGAAFAGDNQSAKFIRMLAREASTDSIDAVYFNPAGTAFLEKGLHIQLNGQMVWLDYSHTVPAFSADIAMKNWIPFVPSGYIGYSGKNWSAFFGYTIPEGGGSLEYGSLYLAVPSGPFAGEVLTGSLTGSAATHALNLGGSYAITSQISIGGSVGMSIGSDSYDVNLTGNPTLGAAALLGTAKVTAGGTGWGGTFGIHLKPVEGLNFSVTAETSQKVDMSVKDSSGSAGTVGFTEGFVDNSNRPWRIRSGLSYAFPFGLEIPVSFKYTFWKALDENVLQNNWSASLALRYWLIENLELSIGTSYATGNVQDSQLDTSFLNPELDSVTLAGGVGWEIFENFSLDVGVLYPFYFQKSGTFYTDMNKQVVNLAVGVGYVF